MTPLEVEAQDPKLNKVQSQVCSQPSIMYHMGFVAPVTKPHAHFAWVLRAAAPAGGGPPLQSLHGSAAMVAFATCQNYASCLSLPQSGL